MLSFVGLGLEAEVNRYVGLLEEDNERPWFVRWVQQVMRKVLGISIYLAPLK